MSNMKRVLEVIESDEELKRVYDHLLTAPMPEDAYLEMMAWLCNEALEIEN